MTPYFSNFSEFLAMGKHGFYVWSAWGVVFFCVVFAVFYVRHERKNLLKKIQQTELRQKSREQARLAKHKTTL